MTGSLERLLIICFFLIPVSITYAHNDREHSLEIIPLPDGFQPEGVARRGHKAYVGSLKSGAIVSIDLLTGKGAYLVAGSSEQAAVGLAIDKRTGLIFVAGGPFGTIKVYDTKNGKQKADYQVDEPYGFINDGIVTEDGVYFTDSFMAQIYRLPLSKGGKLSKSSDIETIALTGDFQIHPDEFNANGIEANDDSLIIVNSFSGLLYNVDPETGHAIQIDLGAGDLKNGDGMWLKDETLYVVQNFLNQIAVVELSEDGLEGEITSIIKSPLFRIPTTITGFGDYLYVVNARFDVAPPPFFGNAPADPTIEYELVGVKKDQGDE